MRKLGKAYPNKTAKLINLKTFISKNTIDGDTDLHYPKHQGLVLMQTQGRDALLSKEP